MVETSTVEAAPVEPMPAEPAPVATAPAEPEVEQAPAATSAPEPAASAPTPLTPAEPVAEASQPQAQAAEAPAAVGVEDKQQLEAIIESAGLQWVETTAAPATPEPEVVAPRPVRKRKPRAVIVDEPLQQVETAAEAPAADPVPVDGDQAGGSGKPAA